MCIAGLSSPPYNTIFFVTSQQIRWLGDVGSEGRGVDQFFASLSVLSMFMATMSHLVAQGAHHGLQGGVWVCVWGGVVLGGRIGIES